MGCNSSTAAGASKASPGAVVAGGGGGVAGISSSINTGTNDTPKGVVIEKSGSGSDKNKAGGIQISPSFSILFRRCVSDSSSGSCASGGTPSALEDGKRYRWELAQTEEITGHLVRICIVSNDTRLRYWIDCSRSDVMYLCAPSVLNEEQRKSGAPLTNEQAAKTRQYLRDSLSVSILFDAGVLKFHSLIHDVDYSSLVGREVSCRDEFVSKRSGKVMHKWRDAAIVDCVQSYVKVHFHGWSAKHDLWLDFDTDDITFVTEKWSLSEEQMSSGGDLNETQLKKTVKAFRPVLPMNIELNKVSSSDLSMKPQLNSASSSGGLLKPTIKPTSPVKGSSAVSSSLVSLTSANNTDGSSKSGKRSRRASFDPGVIDTYNRVRPLASDKSSRVVEFNPEAPRIAQSSPKLAGNVNSPSLKSRKSLTGPTSAPGKASGAPEAADSGACTPGTPSTSSLSPVAGESMTLSGHGNSVSNKQNQELVSLRGGSSRIVQDETDTEVDADGSKTPNISMRKYLHQRTQSFPVSYADDVMTERAFVEAMSHHGLHIFKVEGDGNCLFRAVAHQIWFDQDRHEELRSLCVRHMWKHKQRFSVFCEGDFSEYILHMAESGTWADDIEIRALEELLDRLINIYDVEGSEIKPMNKNFDEEAKFSATADNNPIILSYHGKNHYNSVFDEKIELPLPIKTTNYILRLRMLHFYS